MKTRILKSETLINIKSSSVNVLVCLLSWLNKHQIIQVGIQYWILEEEKGKVFLKSMKNKQIDDKI